MTVKTRINYLERKTQPKKDMLAIFSIPDKLSAGEQKLLEQELWQQYLKDGGDPTFRPIFFSGLSDKAGYLLCLSGDEFYDMLSKNSSRELVIES